MTTREAVRVAKISKYGVSYGPRHAKIGAPVQPPAPAGDDEDQADVATSEPVPEPAPVVKAAPRLSGR
jgi:hypothetical protein